MPSEVQWTSRKSTTEGVQDTEMMITPVEGAHQRGVVVTTRGVHPRKNIFTGDIQTKTTEVHLRKDIDTEVLLTKTNILGREKKEMNGLKRRENTVAIPLTRTNSTLQLIINLLHGFVLCLLYAWEKWECKVSRRCCSTVTLSILLL